MLNFYIFYLVSLTVCIIITLITNGAIISRLKRENKYYRIERTAWEIMHNWLPIFIPFFNILLILVMIFKYDECCKMIAEKCEKERKRREDIQNTSSFIH